MAWTFNTAMTSLSDTATYEQAEKLWEKESLGRTHGRQQPHPGGRWCGWSL